MNGRPTAAAAGKIDVGGDLTVNRLGFGAMRITGPGIWGDPPDRDRAIQASRRAVALDVNFIDTADSYGPEVSERLIAEALYPYPEELVIATKAERVTAIVSVQNRYNVVDRSSEPMLDLCDQEMLVFLPWAPIEDTGAIPAVLAAARRHRVSERQVALAWLLTRSPQVLPIPGSGDPDHVEQNVAAASIELTSGEIRAITRAVRPPAGVS
jgi:aryl-alcohol dehydrogenase-like predicted oxidoreductase